MMKKIFCILLLCISTYTFSQPILANPDGSIKVDGSGNILKNSIKVFDFYSYQLSPISNMNLGYRLRSGANVWIHNGYATGKLTADGSNRTFNISFRSVDTNKVIAIIMWGDLDSLERFSLGNTRLRLDIHKMEQMFPNMVELSLSQGKISSSNLADVPRQVKNLSYNTLTDYNNRMVWGNIDDLPDDMTSINLTLTGDSISGNIANLPRNLISFSLRFGSNSIPQFRGNLSDLPPNLQTLFLWEIGGGWTESIDIRKIKGSYNDIPKSVTSLTFMNLFNSVSGGWDGLPPNLTTFSSHQEVARIQNDSTPLRLGDIPKSVTSLSIQYTNKLSKANRPVTGNISDLPPNLTSLTMRDLDSLIVGSIEDLPATLTALNITVNTDAPISTWGYNKITYSGGTPIALATGTSAINIRTCMSSDAVDAFLIAYALVAGTNTRTINLSGVRTSASDAAVTTLLGKGKTIVTNTTGCP